MKWYEKFFNWFKKGKVKPTKKVPFKRKGEKFGGFKITWPWWGDNHGKSEDR